ncbi:MAG TPA: type II toxin-antitoxin system RelE/ParE family toxin [Pirellulales bacterium]|nr:type II toxin-antitoxin system RelE/ParE family toxin [Pirellulales bacterium]
MTVKLRILARADRDLQGIFNFIAELSPAGAERWWNAFLGAAARATSHPDQHPFAPENSLVDRELRQFFFKTRRGKKYRAIFTIAGDELLILRVRGPAQSPLTGDDLLDD